LAGGSKVAPAADEVEGGVAHGAKAVGDGGDQVKRKHVNSTMHVDEEQSHAVLSESDKELSKTKLRSFKRIPRENKSEIDPKQGSKVDGRKRGQKESEDMEVEDSRLAKIGMGVEIESQTSVLAEPADRLCGNQ
jgi:hypothetical protein